MKKLNQKGAVGPIEIGVLVIVMVVVGALAYRIGSARSDDSSANVSENSEEQVEKSEVSITENIEDAKKEIDVPKEEKKKEEVVVKDPEPVVQEPAPKPVEEPKKTEKKYTYINFTKGGGGQEGDTVSASALLESNQTGKCTVKFYNPPQETIYIESQIKNSRTCQGSANISKFGASGEWQVYTWFESSDGLIQAWNEVYTIDVTI